MFTNNYLHPVNECYQDHRNCLLLQPTSFQEWSCLESKAAILAILRILPQVQKEGVCWSHTLILVPEQNDRSCWKRSVKKKSSMLTKYEGWVADTMFFQCPSLPPSSDIQANEKNQNRERWALKISIFLHHNESSKQLLLHMEKNTKHLITMTVVFFLKSKKVRRMEFSHKVFGLGCTWRLFNSNKNTAVRKTQPVLRAGPRTPLLLTFPKL